MVYNFRITIIQRWHIIGKVRCLTASGCLGGEPFVFQEVSLDTICCFNGVRTGGAIANVKPLVRPACQPSIGSISCRIGGVVGTSSP